MDITHYYHYLPFILIGLLLFLISYFLSILLSSLGIFFTIRPLHFQHLRQQKSLVFLSFFLQREAVAAEREESKAVAISEEEIRTANGKGWSRLPFVWNGLDCCVMRCLLIPVSVHFFVVRYFLLFQDAWSTISTEVSRQYKVMKILFKNNLRCWCFVEIALRFGMALYGAKSPLINPLER